MAALASRTSGFLITYIGSSVWCICCKNERNEFQISNSWSGINLGLRLLEAIPAELESADLSRSKVTLYEVHFLFTNGSLLIAR